MNELPKRPKFTDSFLWLSLKDAIPPEDHEEVQGRLVRAVYQCPMYGDGLNFNQGLMYVFCWGNTKEGHAYWRNINERHYVKFSSIRSIQS